MLIIISLVGFITIADLTTSSGCVKNEEIAPANIPSKNEFDLNFYKLF